MANRSCLFANNDPEPLRYELDDDDCFSAGVGKQCVFVAGCAWQVPVFWLFCFDPEDLTLAEAGEDQIPTLTAPMQRVKARLAEREKRARSLFPELAGVWTEFVAAVTRVKRKYLKVEMGEIWCLSPDTWHDGLDNALAWIAGRSTAGLDDLLGIAGIQRYDHRTGKLSFDEDRECAEKFLYGWLE
jgi:hypothetical protein